MHLTETPLSDDQHITTDGDKHLLSATVADSWQLDWWVKSMGAQIEILQPASLRTSIINDLQQALDNYQYR
jgi:predicted DNA-binding transcriptional regulator YafY